MFFLTIIMANLVRLELIVKIVHLSTNIDLLFPFSNTTFPSPISQRIEKIIYIVPSVAWHLILR